MAMASPVLLMAMLCALFSATEMARGREAAVGTVVAFRSCATDPNTEVKFDFSPFLIQYKSGRVQRFMGTTFVPPSLDACTGLASKDLVLDQATGLCARVYRPSRRVGGGGGKLAVLLYFHGGAFVVESTFDPVYQGYLNALTAKANVVAVSVNYRLTPEHPIPAAYDNAWTALQWVLENTRHGSGGREPWLAKHGAASGRLLHIQAAALLVLEEREEGGEATEREDGARRPCCGPRPAGVACETGRSKPGGGGGSGSIWICFEWVP